MNNTLRVSSKSLMNCSPLLGTRSIKIRLVVGTPVLYNVEQVKTWKENLSRKRNQKREKFFGFSQPFTGNFMFSTFQLLIRIFIDLCQKVVLTCTVLVINF